MLLTAIFISVFLYFLAVALVMANRQDILLALSVDHRLRADMAARAGAAVALQTMRTNSNWQEVLDKASGTMESGATWSVRVSTYPDSADTGYIKEIVSTGRSGFLTSTYRQLVEETTLHRTSLSGSSPLLFMLTTGGTLAVLDSSFKWTTLGSMPRQDAWMAARGGPLFTFAPRGTASAPGTITDFLPTTDSHGILQPGTTQVTLDTSQDEHALYLTFDQSTASWRDVPDPGLSLARQWPATIDGDPNGSPRWQTVTVQGQQITYTDSEFTGPVVEWYGLRGPALAASGSILYCHATHYLYQGFRFQNNVSVQNGVLVNNPTRQSPQLYQEPAVLAFDVASGNWQKIVDLMLVPDPHSQPVIDQGPRPDTATLGVVDNKVYAYQSGNPRQVLVGAERSFQTDRLTDGSSGALVGYRERLLVHAANGRGVDDLARVALGGLDPYDEMHFQAGAHQAERWKGTRFEPLLVYPQAEAGLTLEIPNSTASTRGAGCVAVLGNDLYTVGRLRRHYTRADGMSYLAPYDTDAWWTQNQRVEALVLVHYDGAHWQVWPQGIEEALATLQAGTGTLSVRDSQGNALQLSPEFLAAGLYQGEPSVRLNRYGVLGVWR